MGCECLKIKNLEKEIVTQNTEENHMLMKKENIVTSDTYINSIKTTDKNIELIQPKAESNIDLEKKIYNSKYNPNVIKSKRPSQENNYEIKKALNTDANKNDNSKSTINEKNVANINKSKPKTKTNLISNAKKVINNKKPLDQFSQYIFNHINKIRENPESFIDKIEQEKFNVEYNKSNKLIYKKNIKVALSQGLPAFEEAISILKITKPMNKLIFEPKLMVKLPETEEDLMNKKYLKLEIKKMKDKGIPIKSYWRDIIKEPETSFLMMIVDDTGVQAGLKRKDILDPNLKYIGISSKFIGKHFICFMTFSEYKVN